MSDQYLDTLTKIQIEQSQEIYNAVYDLLCAIVKTHEDISKAFHHPFSFVVGAVKDKILFNENTTQKEVEETCKDVVTQSEIIVQKMFNDFTKFCDKHPNLKEFVVTRFQKMGENITEINEFIIKVQKIINLVGAICPVLAAIVSIINNILGLFGFNIPLLNLFN